jgi:2-keto-4-pentenoate hydratase
MRTRCILAAAALATAAAAAPAACLTDAQAQQMADNYMAKKPSANPEMASEADASCSRAKLNALLQQKFGPVIGYKAGLTNPAVQKRFNATEPVWGKLYQGMLLADGASVEPAFGARPLFEADMLVRVRSADINQARTPMEVLAAVDQVIPFIELPDLVVEAPARLNGFGVSAINVGARMGVAGKPVPVPATRGERYAMLDALKNMTVILDGNGTELGRGKGSDILEHPLNAVIWLSQALAREGLQLKPGELISLGSFSPLLPPKAGTRVTASYHGLPGAAPVSMQFK